MKAERDQQQADAPLLPRIMLEAGGELMSTLGNLAHRRMEELAPGQILELISSEPSTRTRVADWCGAAGHELLRLEIDGDVTRFWIRKLGSLS
jgi:TusA-related sulfurtransferase